MAHAYSSNPLGSIRRTPSVISSAPPANVAASQPQIASLAPSFRTLVWNASIPLRVSLDPSDFAGRDLPISSHYISAPRLSYLTLLLPALKEQLVSLALDRAALAGYNEDEWWFEFEGTPLRWHWPVGLLYDYHTGNPATTAITGLGQPGRSPSTAPKRDDYFASTSATSSATAASTSQSKAHLPWSIKLRLRSPPLDKLGAPSGSSPAQVTRTSFMSMLKEADFVRYGSTKRVVNLRKVEQDALWEGLVEHDFDKYWSVASKVVPAPSMGASSSQVTADPSLSSRRPSITLSSSDSLAETSSEAERAKFGSVSSNSTFRPGFPAGMSLSGANESATSLSPSAVTSLASGTGDGESRSPTSAANTLRSVPVRIHLPEDAPIVQEPVPPFLEDGRPATVATLLSSLFPLLFPPRPSFSSFMEPPPALAYPVVQGIQVPLETEIGWLGATLGMAEGWVSIVIVLLQDEIRP